MTKENRESQYKHFRDLEANYVALPGRDHDLEKTDVLKGRAKENADAMLKKHPELSEFDKKEVKEEIKEKVKPKVEVKPKGKKDGRR